MIPVICMVSVAAPLDDRMLQILMPCVPTEKQDRIRRQRVRQNADNMLAGAALARHMLWQEFRIPYTAAIAYGPYGKPYLVDHPDAHFNISHSGRYVVCIVCDRPVGIDIQEIVPYHPEIAVNICSTAEMAWIDSSAVPAAEFIRIWTKKEAFSKLTGNGIAGELKELRFPEHVHFWQFNYRMYMITAAYL